MDTLKGVIVDWATAQIEGLNAAVGNECAELPMVLKKKQVHFLRAVQYTGDKVCSGFFFLVKTDFYQAGIPYHDRGG